MIKSAKPVVPMPGFLPYLDPTEVDRPPTGKGWAHEIKWDGYRAQAHLEEGRVTIFTRNGNDWTTRFGPVASAVHQLEAQSAILDGEAVAIAADGMADFHELRRQLDKPRARIFYKAFDLLWLDGEDLRRLPWRERKIRLRALLVNLPKSAARVIEYVEPLSDEGAAVYAGVCDLGLEGIVSKRLDGLYVAGRSINWVKTKCAVTETFAVVGFDENERGRIDSLYVARRAGEKLLYAATVENGFDAADVRAFEKRLRPLAIARSPLSVAVRKSKARWVRPEVLVEISYSNTSKSGLLRHPRFKGFRDDIG